MQSNYEMCTNVIIITLHDSDRFKIILNWLTRQICLLHYLGHVSD